jgi:hypothetical protein
MSQPFKRVLEVVSPAFLAKTMMIALILSAEVLLAQQAIRINPDFFSEEITISDTLAPIALKSENFPDRLSALQGLGDPLLLDSIPEMQTYLYRLGIDNRFPVLMVAGKGQWTVFKLKQFEGYGIPKIYKIHQKKSGLVLIEATLRERYFTSEEFPSGFQAEKGIIQLIDVNTGMSHLQQVSNLKIEQGRWSNGPEGNVASSYEQLLKLSLKNQLMNFEIIVQKKKYTTATGTQEKSSRISLEYKFQNGVWIRSKAAIMSY